MGSVTSSPLCLLVSSYPNVTPSIGPSSLQKATLKGLFCIIAKRVRIELATLGGCISPAVRYVFKVKPCNVVEGNRRFVVAVARATAHGGGLIARPALR
jgi:hypothetical protein